MNRLVSALVLALLLPLPAVSLTVDQLEGRWQGEGVLLLGEEPEQRFRCRIRLRTISDGQSFFSGRCATSQASQSFTYMLFERADGAVRAENRAEPPSDLPPLMQGIAQVDLLRLEADEDRVFQLRLDGETLHFRIEGSGDRGMARGTAQMTRRN